MIKRLTLLAAPLLALTLPTPALAQDGADDAADMMSALGEMFATEPLTAEEEARLPAAQALVEKIIPPGTMQDVMGGMFDSLLNPMLEMTPITAEIALSKRLGMGESGLGIGEQRAIQALAMIDPAWEEREQRERDALPDMMARMMVAMEPTIKSAMSELYAIYFNEQELADIDQFFSTESGAAYARKSFTMSADPRMAGAMMEMMPAIFSVIGEMESEMAKRTADLPAQRSFERLSAEQRAKLAGLTGMSEDALADGMAQAAEPFPGF